MRTIISILLLVGVTATAQTVVPLMVHTNGGVMAPLRFWGGQSTDTNFVAAVQAVGTNYIGATGTIWGWTLSASNGAVTSAATLIGSASNSLVAGTLSSSNGAVASAAAFTTAVSNALWLGTITVSNATFWAVSNASYVALAAATNQAEARWRDAAAVVPLTVGDSASTVAGGYARWVESAGGPKMSTNGQLAKIATGLTAIFAAVGTNTMVDGAVLRRGQTVGSGTNIPSFYGRLGRGDNIQWDAAGIFFNGSNSKARWFQVPDFRTNTVAVRFSAETNMAATHGVYSYQSTNGYTYGISLAMMGSFTHYYPFTYRVSLSQGGGLFGRVSAGPLSEGAQAHPAVLGNRSAMNYISSIDVVGVVTNLLTWQDGLLARWQQSTNYEYVQIPTNACNLFALGSLDTNYFWKGRVESWFLFNRALASNEVRAVDAAMAYMADEIPIIILGDSKSELNYYATNTGTDWPSQMFWQLGDLTNRVSIKNFSLSGYQANNLQPFMASVGPYRATSLARPRGFAFETAGQNDFYWNDTNSALSNPTNVFNTRSNTWRMFRTNGMEVVALDVLKWGTNLATYVSQNLAAQLTRVDAHNALLAAAATNALPPMDHFLSTATMVTNLWDVTELYDGVHFTAAKAAAIGQMIGTNLLRWIQP